MRTAQRPFDPARAADYPAVVGCDEVGRGALCGPVVVAAVWFDPRVLSPALIGALDDSKKLTARVRDALADEIMLVARVRVAAASASTIDRKGIRNVTLEAMCRAIDGLGLDAPAFVDGDAVPPGMAGRCEAVVRGDGLVPQIAAGSIVAKTLRDRLMATLACRHPGYRWERNAGYGTADHLDALRRLGPSRHHRQSFAPVSQAAFTFPPCIDPAFQD